MPPRRRGSAPPPNPWTHLDAQGRHLPGVVAEAPLADDGSVDDDSMYDSDNDAGTPARAASGPADPAPRPAVVTQEWLDAKKAELKRREEEQPIQMFFSRILAFFFIAAIIRAAIKGPDPPAG